VADNKALLDLGTPCASTIYICEPWLYQGTNDSRSKHTMNTLLQLATSSYAAAGNTKPKPDILPASCP
jgi:hypothetical protein